MGHSSVDNPDPETPDNGWLVIACFHALWSSASVTAMSSVTELVPIYQDVVSFLSVRCDVGSKKCLL
jgi:hypothetical protein